MDVEIRIKLAVDDALTGHRIRKATQGAVKDTLAQATAFDALLAVFKYLDS